MANRHTHKKLRAEIRARMAETGESYQTAWHRVLAHVPERPKHATRVDLVPFTYFGVPITLATSEALAFQLVTVIRHAPQHAHSWTPPVTTWLHPRGVN